MFEWIKSLFKPKLTADELTLQAFNKVIAVKRKPTVRKATTRKEKAMPLKNLQVLKYLKKTSKLK